MERFAGKPDNLSIERNRSRDLPIRGNVETPGFGKEECVQETHQGFLARSIPARRRHSLRSRLYSAKKKRHAIACLFFLAEWVGFEPTVPLPVHLISSQGRYNHFDTAPYVCCSLSIIAGTGSKIKEIFRRFTCV